MTEVINDPYELFQFNMVRAHSTFKLGFDIILSRLDDPPLDDLPNFLGYCQSWADSIDHHHKTEEAIVFPFLNKKLDFSTEAEQHNVIHTALDELLEFIHAAKGDRSQFDNQKLKGMMERLREPLFTHLDAEVEHIKPDNLKDFEAQDLVWLNTQVSNHARATSDVFTVLPFMRSHTPPEFKATWPPIPWAIRNIVIPYVFAMMYSGYWKYSPYPVS